MSVREPFSPLLMNPLDLALEKAMEHANGQQLFFYARYAGDLVFKVLDLGPTPGKSTSRFGVGKSLDSVHMLPIRNIDSDDIPSERRQRRI